MEGFLLVRKPAGVSSFQVVKKCRYFSTIKKIGHAGTLDPFASGLLVIGIGRNYTRQIDEFQSLPKSYLVKMCLGIETDTLDSMGSISNQSVPGHYKEFLKGSLKNTIEPILNSFLGTQLQTPPIYSAKKVNGKRLYKLARKGLSVDIKPREVTLHSCHYLSDTETDYPCVTFKVNCSKGYYIRSLVKDIGTQLGLPAYTKDLVRLSIGSYYLKDALNYEDITAESMAPKLFNSIANDTI